MRKIYTVVLAMLLALVGATSATAYDPQEEAELKVVNWLMVGQNHSGWAEWNNPQTFYSTGTGNLPACWEGGEAHFQSDTYKYGTDELKGIVDGLIAGGTLTQGGDSRVLFDNRYWFTTVPACVPASPVTPPAAPQTPVETPAVSVPTAPTQAVTAAPAASPVVAKVTFTG